MYLAVNSINSTLSAVVQLDLGVANSTLMRSWRASAGFLPAVAASWAVTTSAMACSLAESPTVSQMSSPRPSLHITGQGLVQAFSTGARLAKKMDDWDDEPVAAV